jgi:hypothetical protein
MPQVNGDCGNPSGAQPPLCGVWGDCRDDAAVVGTSVQSLGLTGYSRTASGAYGYSTLDRGMIGTGRRFGVHGLSVGQGSDSDPTVYAGVYAQGADYGLVSVGVLGLYSRGDGQAGYFRGSVWVDGNFTVLSPGVKSAAVPHPDGTLRQLCALESPESWFEDFGRAELTRGHAQVELDPDFAALVDTDVYHVFVTPEGDSNGLYTSARTPSGFEVREQGGGTSTLPFSYRVVARRKDVRAGRLQSVERPPERALPELPPNPEPPSGWERE